MPGVPQPRRRRSIDKRIGKLPDHSHGGYSPMVSGSSLCRSMAGCRHLSGTCPREGSAQPLVFGELVKHRPDIGKPAKQHLDRKAALELDAVFPRQPSRGCCRGRRRNRTAPRNHPRCCRLRTSDAAATDRASVDDRYLPRQRQPSSAEDAVKLGGRTAAAEPPPRTHRARIFPRRWPSRKSEQPPSARPAPQIISTAMAVRGMVRLVMSVMSILSLVPERGWRSISRGTDGDARIGDIKAGQCHV